MLKVLVAPLDWGIGHATRCIPIVKELISQCCTVIIAARGAQKAVLQDEFPDLSFVEMPGFRVNYGKNRAFTLLKIISQIPKILIGIKRENQWLRRFAGQEGLDLVISDNRYGLYGSGFFSVFMTHQLAIRSSMGGMVDGWVRRMNYGFVNRFSVCWVPDVEGLKDSLAGTLSHPPRMPAVPVRYIGWLSRLGSGGPVPDLSSSDPIDLLILLSGPEPQRTILERILLAQLSGEMGRIVVVRGLPKGDGAVGPPAAVQVFDYLPARELEQLLRRSKVVLARSGYSTVMDLVRMGKRAIYVPTPGQPEQEYLGQYLEAIGWGVCVNQKGLVLKEAIRRSYVHGDRPASAANGLLQEEIVKLLAMVKAARPQSAVADLG